jgi:two-component system cell cycle sensor histidine kinase/response regulator CckA
MALDRARCDELGWGEPGTYAVLTMGDTGAGMDEETRQHLFEPFFTTKPVGSGTGLGMPMVYGLVKQHNGFIQVDSEPGRTTTVTIYLPLVTESPRAATPRRSDPKRGGRETILVAEDEESLRRATRRILERQGYTVLVAADGQEALDIFRARRADIALIVSDVVMPGLGGAQLWKAVQKEPAPPPVLFTSGYTDRDSLGAAALPPDVPFLPKPWTIPELLSRIRELLDAPAAS